MISAIMGRYYYSKKEEADNLNKIQVWLLNKYGFFNGGWRSGVITMTNGWNTQKTKINIVVNVFGTDNYIEFSYKQIDRNGEENEFNYKVPLVATPCYFGGKRYWFSCSASRNGIYCGRRVAVLYKEGDYFACRHCYDLSYESKNENRRFRNYGLFYVLGNHQKIEKLEKEIKRKLYAGKPTRKQQILSRLYRRQMPYMLNLYKNKVLTK